MASRVLPSRVLLLLLVAVGLTRVQGQGSTQTDRE